MPGFVAGNEIGKALVQAGEIEAFAKQLEEIAKSAAKVGELVAEITVTSGEQAQGIEQMNMAVTDMNKAVHRNSANAGQSAGASEERNYQAKQVKIMLSGPSITEKYALLLV